MAVAEATNDRWWLAAFFAVVALVIGFCSQLATLVAFDEQVRL